MPDINTLTDLQTRVRAAALEMSFDAHQVLSLEMFRALTGAEISGIEKPHARAMDLLSMPVVTYSIDAAVALIERVLPGWAWSCGSCSVTHDATVHQRAWLAPDADGPDTDLLSLRHFDEGFHGDRRDGNAPLALLDAMLSALIAKSKADKTASALSELAEIDRGLIP